LGLGIDVERIAAIELNYLAKAELDWDSSRVTPKSYPVGTQDIIRQRWTPMDSG